MRALFFLLFSALCHSVIYAWLLRAFPRLRQHKKIVLAIFALLVALVPLGRVVIYRADNSLGRIVSAVAMAELLAALIAMLPILGIQLAARFVKRTATSISISAPTSTSTSTSTSTPTPTSTSTAALTAIPIGRREVFERAAGLAVLGASGGSIAWGAIRGRLDFEIEEVIVKIPGLPKALEGYTIAQVSDIHVGVFVQESELRQGFEFVARTKPDLVVATGDLVDSDPRFIALMARSLGDLKARDGVAAILGNHDYYTGGDDVRALLLKSGVRALVNEHVVLRSNDGGGFVLGGADDYAGARHGTEGPSVTRTFAGAPDRPRILLAHQPQFFAESRGQVALQLSGHVHGGQINPIIRPADYVLRYVAGRYEEGGSTMWVNRGFGTAGPPARVGSRPEISKIVLVSG